MRRNKLACVFFATFLIGTFSYIFLHPQLIQSAEQQNQNKGYDFIESSNYTVVKSLKDTINILLYTKLWGYHNWRLSNETIDKNSPEFVNCSYKNCIFTNNQNYLENVHDYDALFFHQDPGCWYNKSFYDAIKTRSPHQLYVLAAQEAPANMKVQYFERSNIFNLTMTYRLDSEIEWFYGKIIDIARNEVVAPAKNVVWRTPDENFQDDEIERIVRGKTKTAAWIVSECNRPSKRHLLVQKMQNFMGIDIYGRCGTMECNPKAKDCIDYTNDYRFYLAFENSLCVDYITEKTFKVLDEYIVPVIYSAVDLSNFLPPKSYIDANAFNTAEELANHLNYLANRPKEYMKYFWWKKYYRTEHSHFNPCRICKKFNEPGFMSTQHIIPSIDDWFNKDTCFEPKIKF